MAADPCVDVKGAVASLGLVDDRAQLGVQGIGAGVTGLVAQVIERRSLDLPQSLVGAYELGCEPGISDFLPIYDLPFTMLARYH